MFNQYEFSHYEVRVNKPRMLHVTSSERISYKVAMYQFEINPDTDYVSIYKIIKGSDGYYERLIKTFNRNDFNSLKMLENE